MVILTDMNHCTNKHCFKLENKFEDLLNLFKTGLSFYLVLPLSCTVQQIGSAQIKCLHCAADSSVFQHLIYIYSSRDTTTMYCRCISMEMSAY